jgi:hypothetical protein
MAATLGRITIHRDPGRRMRRFIFTLAAAAALALPSPAAADAISQLGFGQQSYGGGFLTVDTTGGSPAFLFQLVGLDEAQGPPGWTVTDAYITLVSPAFEGMQIDVAADVTTYDFAPGSLTIDLTLASDTTPEVVSGSFHAALPAFSFSVRDERGLFGDCPCSDMLEFLNFEGMLDQSLADALRVQYRTINGSLWLLSERIDGPYGDYREGPGIGLVSFAVVPEPSSMLLLGVSAAGLLIRRRK